MFLFLLLENQFDVDRGFSPQKLLSRHKEMSEKAKAMMERLKINNMENVKNDANVSLKLSHFRSILGYY